MTETEKLGIQLGVICARMQLIRERMSYSSWIILTMKHPEMASWFDDDGVPVIPLNNWLKAE